MRVTDEKIENQEVTLTIEADASVLEKAEAAASQSLANRLSIPGFRKGKAPRKVIERRIGKEALLAEAFDRVAQDAFLEAIKEKDLEPVTRPKVDVVTLEEGKDVVFTAVFTPKPEVKLGDYKGLSIPKKLDAVTDEDVEKQIENMRARQGKLVDAPEGAAVENGNFITLDFTGSVDGQEFPGGTGKDYPLQVGSKSFIPGFEDQLIGMKVGEERDVNVTFPEDYKAEDLAGKAAKFACKVNSIKVRELPPLDDELAKKVSKFQTLEELRADVRKNLEHSAEQKAENDRKSAAIEKAAENIEVQIPPVMIDNRVSLMIQEMAMRLRQQGLDFEQYMKYAGTDVSKLRESYRQTAEQNIRTDLMLEAVAKAEGIVAEAKDLESEVAQMALAYGATPAEVRKIVKEQGRTEDLKMTALRKKTANFIIENLAAE